MQAKKRRVAGLFYSAILVTSLLFLTGCSDTKTINFKINSVPKGAHVLYQVVGEDVPCQGEWIYLGNTPVLGVRQFDEDRIEDAEKITLKIIHRGYHEQIKEWDGPGFWKEVEERDVIFWTPELIHSPKDL